MNNLAKTIGLALAISIFPSCASMYRGIGTIESCLPKEDEEKMVNRVINYFQYPDSSAIKFSEDNNRIYPITKPDKDNIKINLRFMQF